MMFEQIYLFRNAIDCISFRYVKLSTQWKKLIMFSKDMAVVIYNKKEGSHLLGDGMPSALQVRENTYCCLKAFTK